MENESAKKVPPVNNRLVKIGLLVFFLMLTVYLYKLYEFGRVWDEPERFSPLSFRLSFYQSGQITISHDGAVKSFSEWIELAGSSEHLPDFASFSESERIIGQLTQQGSFGRFSSRHFELSKYTVFDFDESMTVWCVAVQTDYWWTDELYRKMIFIDPELAPELVAAFEAIRFSRSSPWAEEVHISFR